MINVIVSLFFYTCEACFMCGSWLILVSVFDWKEGKFQLDKKRFVTGLKLMAPTALLVMTVVVV